jgi:hypothetical protein
MKTFRAGKAVALFAAIWLACWGIQIILLNRGGRANAFHTSEGYSETVDLFLTHEWLRYDNTKDQIVPNFPAHSAAARFYRASYLERDVAAFNSGRRSVFRVDNSRIVALDPNLHNIALPFAELRSWPGLLTFRPGLGTRGELRGKGVTIELSGPTRSLHFQNQRLQEVLLRRQAPKVAGLPVQGEALNLFGEGEIFFGKTHMIGNSILFNHRNLESGVRISISGEEVRQGNRSRLDSGDLLKLQWRPGNRPTQYALLWSSILGEAPVISTYRAVNGHYQRHPEHPQPLLGGVIVESLDGVMRRRDKNGAYQLPERQGRFDLSLSLDANLQGAVERRLNAYARRLRAPEEPPFRAAVTVMDAKTGELLALASFPTEDDLAGWKEAAAARERLLRNHNFSRLPVGSVAKVILSAAILDAAPFLADLKIRGYSGKEFDQMLGISLRPTLSDHPYGGGADGLVDFDEFIEHSSNKYATTLLTLATAIDENRQGLLPPADEASVPDRLDAAEQFYLGGTLYDRRPGLRLPLVADPEKVSGRAFCGPITTLELLDYPSRLTSLFGVPISKRTLTSAADRPRRRGPGEGDDLIDTSLWLPLLDYLYGHDSIPADHPLFAAAPERENLEYNLIKDFRAQYLSLILGGGSSRWTNPQLCRIFSALVTGRRPQTTLVRRIQPLHEPAVEPKPVTEPLPMNPQVRQRLVDAMTRVAGPQGTAKLLNGLLLGLDQQLAAKGKALGFFSKTGSPNDSSFLPTRTARAVDALIANGALHLGPRDQILYRDTGPVSAEPPEEGGPGLSLEALEANPADMALLRRFRVSPRFVVRVCDTWNKSRPVDRTQFDVQNHKLVRMLKVREVDSVGGAYVFTLGIYDNAARLPAPGPGYLPRIDVVHHQPERALSVAILIENQGQGPRIAVPFAKQLIEQVLWDALQKGW